MYFNRTNRKWVNADTNRGMISKKLDVKVDRSPAQVICPPVHRDRLSCRDMKDKGCEGEQ